MQNSQKLRRTDWLAWLSDWLDLAIARSANPPRTEVLLNEVRRMLFKQCSCLFIRQGRALQDCLPIVIDHQPKKWTFQGW